MKWPRSHRPKDFDDFIESIVNGNSFKMLPLTNEFEVVRLARYDGTFLIYRTAKGKLSWHPELFQLYKEWSPS